MPYVLISVAAAMAAAGIPLLRGPVGLQPQAAVAQGQVAAYPRVAEGPGVTAAAARRINAALEREQRRAVAAAADCNASYRAMQHKPSSDAWSRTVEVTMRGPAYLAATATDSYFCGGPYPNDGLETQLVYDLSTGAPVDWLALFPRGAKAASDSSGDGSRLGFVVWPELTRRFRTQAGADCKDVLDGDEGGAAFQISLDARSGALEATPAGLPHVVQACADEVELTVPELRKLGFSPRLVTALQAAQRLQR